MNLHASIFFITLSIVSSVDVLGQGHNRMEIERITTLGKDSITEIAHGIVRQKYPDLDIILGDFDISVWSNTQEVLVQYKRRIRFVPLGQETRNYTYDFTVHVMPHGISPFDFFGVDDFYLPTSEDREKISFVQNAFGLPRQWFDSEVTEMENKYVVSLSNEVSFGIYEIDKVTGMEIPQSSIEGNWEPEPDILGGEEDKDPYVEIKE
ncbi:hypothetical protein [Reichenbachiella sp. MSK19-1]|uniref:hypothetical protein n=1 Tax=Reichenbachiella sp. MSK19-1 TaxID=1897631 RepID=UPI000E6C3511|nr:hypothetical protein [Reichenbachiella sp. MSK19-1]RJE72019.1 hypothetical protein BGP76_08040 [Reichenbachiella sp. MSK19-1]